MGGFDGSKQSLSVMLNIYLTVSNTLFTGWPIVARYSRFPFSHDGHLHYSVKHTFHRLAHNSHIYKCSRFPFNHDGHLPCRVKHTFHRMAHNSHIYRCSSFPFNHDGHLHYSVKHTFHRMARSNQYTGTVVPFQSWCTSTLLHETHLSQDGP